MKLPYWLRNKQKSNEEWVRQWEKEIARDNHGRADNIAIILSQRLGETWLKEKK